MPGHKKNPKQREFPFIIQPELPANLSPGTRRALLSLHKTLERFNRTIESITIPPGIPTNYFRKYPSGRALMNRRSFVQSRLERIRAGLKTNIAADRRFKLQQSMQSLETELHFIEFSLEKLAEQQI
ncbi:MAG: hypothetical protein ABIH20_02515 [Candidatus Diapherotrites archaeon]